MLEVELRVTTAATLSEYLKVSLVLKSGGDMRAKKQLLTIFSSLKPPQCKHGL